MQSKSHRSHSSSSSSLKTKVPKTNQQKTVKSFEHIWREACVLYSYLLLSSTKWSCRRCCLPFYLCASSMDAADDGEAAVAVPSVPTALNPCFVLMGPWPKCTAVAFWFTPPGLLFVESKGGKMKSVWMEDSPSIPGRFRAMLLDTDTGNTKDPWIHK